MCNTIHIAGGGLCGLTLGIGLRKNAIPVILHEAGNYPRHKVCGEFICGVDENTLQLLGIGQCLRDAVLPKTVAWFDPKKKLRSDSIPARAYGISRHALDSRLANLFSELGGELHTGSRCREVNQTAWIDCTGRLPNRQSSWIGLKCHLRAFELEADLEMHLSEDGYVGLNEVEDGRINLCGLFRRRTFRATEEKPLIHAYLEGAGLDALYRRLSDSQPIDGSACAVAALDYEASPETEDADTCRLGDAAGLIPPFTGNGMSLAFENAAMALPLLVDYANGKLDWEGTRRCIQKTRAKRFNKRLGQARHMHEWITNPRRMKLTTRFAQTPFFPFQSLFRATH